jgi:CubicO group peptidase (beta-lactamase class C family)
MQHSLRATTLLGLLGVVEVSRAHAQQELDPDPLASAEARIEDLVGPQAEANLFSGLILVARGRQVLFERAFGYSDWELKALNTPSTRFGIASMAKAMTGALVHVLEAESRLDLDAPIEQYLPGFPRGPNGGVPTVRQLLNHQAGVPHRVTEPWEESRYLSPEAIVERVKAAGLLFEPGSRRLYSSAGFTCLARIAEVVEGRPFEAILQEFVFEPAQMSSAVSETGQRPMPRRAMPHRLGADEEQVVVKKSPFKDLRFLTGAGSVYATAQDLLTFVASVSSGTFGVAVRDEVVGGDPDEWRGWAGRTNGYEGWVDIHPGRDLVLVVLTNLQSAANWQLHEQIRNVLIGQPSRTIPLPPAVTASFEEPESLVGSFGPAEITYADGELSRGDNEFYPTDGGRYYIPASGTLMRFRRDTTGRVDAIISIGGDGRENVLQRSNRDGS